MKDSARLLQFLSENKKRISSLLILMHDYPDPDSIASAFALHYLAQKHYGIGSKMVYGGIISRVGNRYMVKSLKIPLHKLQAKDFERYPHVAVVDTQPAFKNNSFPNTMRATIVIDQHPSVVSPSADLVIVDARRDATCEILAEALLSFNKDIPPALATALVYGILTDTLNLYRAKRRTIFKVYLKLLSYCNMKVLVRLQNPPKKREFFTILVKSITNAVVRGKVIYCHLGQIEDLVFVAHTVDFLLSYQGMRWAFSSGRYKGRLYVSLRATNPDSMASEVLRDVVLERARAGGHGSVAGGSVEVKKEAPESVWKHLEKELTQRLIRRLRISSKKRPHFPFRLTSS